MGSFPSTEAASDKQELAALRKEFQQSFKDQAKISRSKLHPNLRPGIFQRYRFPYDIKSLTPCLMMTHLTSDSHETETRKKAKEANDKVELEEARRWNVKKARAGKNPAESMHEGTAADMNAHASESLGYIEAQDTSFPVRGISRDLEYSGSDTSTLNSSRSTSINLGSIIELSQQAGQERLRNEQKNGTDATGLEKDWEHMHLSEEMKQNELDEEEIRVREEAAVILVDRQKSASVKERRLRRAGQQRIPIAERYQREEREKYYKREKESSLHES